MTDRTQHRPANPRETTLLSPLTETDPRESLDARALVLASRNAYPVVANQPARRDGAGLAAGAAIALALGGLTFFSMSGHRTPAPRPAAPVATIPPAPTTMLPAPLPLPAPRGLLLPATPPITPAMPQQPRPVAPVMVYDTSAPEGAPVVVPAPAAPGTAAARAGGNSGGGGTDTDQFAARVSDGDVQVASARQLSDPAATVTQGTLIPAVLETAIDTDLPGYARALVSRDVKSFDGAHVLIPRSSRLIGQYKSGLAAGQRRAYVIWTRLIRPDGASVALGSPAVDMAGTSGLAGKVDDHFMKRFSSAALLTVIGGLSAIGNASVVLSGGGQSAASVAAQRDTAIPPTIRVAQGQPIRVFTAKDLDFSGVPTVTASR
ncbi:TrbI/VirB10 family protein [Sphingomonas sp.]|uniref:TrbI/VirB10 family protein n=1 Tax=Sphingomonas sp. TaxID=28214 RepID=UPI003AFF7832